MGYKYYTTWGSVRGDCGHAHRSLAAALRCLANDRDGARKQGGYSDREIRGISDRREIMTYNVVYGPGDAVDVDLEEDA